MTLLRWLRGRVERRGQRGPEPPSVVFGLSAHERAILRRCQPYTMTSPERVVATMDAVEHVVRRAIPGALVECGVWRGGSVLAMLLTLRHLGVDDRDVYLYDTFTGMTEPTEVDTSAYHPPAVATFERAHGRGERAWRRMFGADVFGRQQVEQLVAGSGYPASRIHIVEGPVEETLPDTAPADIAVLRLDTDWYASTRHELEHLYPRLRRGGVLLVDDYGHWDGARRAVEEYFDREGNRPLLARTDYTGRVAVKV